MVDGLLFVIWLPVDCVVFSCWLSVACVFGFGLDCCLVDELVVCFDLLVGSLIVLV